MTNKVRVLTRNYKHCTAKIMLYMTNKVRVLTRYQQVKRCILVLYMSNKVRVLTRYREQSDHYEGCIYLIKIRKFNKYIKKGGLIIPPFSFYMYVSDKLFINWFYFKDFVFNTVNHFSCHDTLITLCHV